MFTYATAAQVCAFFAWKAGGAINILKLMKLLYLSERESLRRHESPIIYDRFVSMDNGPVLSRTYELLCGTCYDKNGAREWEKWISRRDQHDIKLQREVSEKMLDHLSRANLEILNDIWEQFGGKNQWELSDYTHKHCSEWRDPKHSSIPIRYEEILLALGKSKSIARNIAEEIQGQRELDEVFASLQRA